MSARIFVDTNVLVYARDRTDEEEHPVISPFSHDPDSVLLS
jgi:predicted nucleic acid-binding protein